MRVFDKYSCILCKYKKYNKDKEHGCWEARGLDEYGYPIGECKSLSNIYYGTLINFFPFKQIDDFRTERAWRKEEKYTKEMDEKYADCSLEDDDTKFIWGVKSWDCLSGSDANLYTMNDIDITYDKKEKKYMLGIETAYMFKTHAAECDYLRNCLDAFTKYMDDNGLEKNKPYMLFMSNPCTSMVAESVEELYVNFKIFVDGFCNQDIDMENMKRVRPIDASKLMNLLEKELDMNGITDWGKGYMDAIHDAMEHVKFMPTLEQNEIKHGHWTLLDECANAGVYCSVCSKKVYKTDYANQKLKSKYCPNCGSIMDEEFEVV